MTTWTRLAALLAALLTLTACGGDGDTDATTATGTGTSTGSDRETAAETDFPVTIQHKFGETTIESEPQRVVSVGFNDQDPLLALGITPVAVREWFGGKPHATWVWAQDELGDAEPTVLPVGELDFEQVAALQPDLIVGIYSGMTQEQYGLLSQIAPTVAQSDDYVDFGVPWQEQTRIIGRAVGREDRAEELISALESRFEAVREQHAAFQDATGMVGFLGGGDADYHVYGRQDLRSRFMTALGFEIPEEVARFVGDEFSAPISRERLSLTDVDVMVWVVNDTEGREQLADEPLYQRLDVVKEGRDLFLEPDGQLAGALSFSTVLSLPFLLDELVPQLAAAVDGNPRTEVTTEREPSPSPGRS